jgi:hypothetical protein
LLLQFCVTQICATHVAPFFISLHVACQVGTDLWPIGNHHLAHLPANAPAANLLARDTCNGPHPSQAARQTSERPVRCRLFRVIPINTAVAMITAIRAKSARFVATVMTAFASPAPGMLRRSCAQLGQVNAINDRAEVVIAPGVSTPANPPEMLNPNAHRRHFLYSHYYTGAVSNRIY